MFVGDVLVAHGLLTHADVAAALERQKLEGGRLGDNLVALGKIKPEDLESIMHQAPPGPRTLADTELAIQDLLNLAIKAMYAGGAETPSVIGEIIKLPFRVVQLIIEQAWERKLLDVLGAAGNSSMSELRYALT